MKDPERKYEKKTFNQVLTNQAKVALFLDRKVRLLFLLKVLPKTPNRPSDPDLFRRRHIPSSSCHVCIVCRQPQDGCLKHNERRSYTSSLGLYHAFFAVCGASRGIKSTERVRESLVAKTYFLLIAASSPPVLVRCLSTVSTRMPSLHGRRRCLR